MNVKQQEEIVRKLESEADEARIKLENYKWHFISSGEMACELKGTKKVGIYAFQLKCSGYKCKECSL